MNETIEGAASQIQTVDFRQLENEIETIQSLDETSNFEGAYLDNESHIPSPVLSHKLKASAETMHVLYDECPTQFQFGIKQARLMTQAVMLLAGSQTPQAPAYSSYMSAAL